MFVDINNVLHMKGLRARSPSGCTLSSRAVLHVGASVNLTTLCLLVVVESSWVESRVGLLKTGVAPRIFHSYSYLHTMTQLHYIHDTIEWDKPK